MKPTHQKKQHRDRDKFLFKHLHWPLLKQYKPIYLEMEGKKASGEKSETELTGPRDYLDMANEGEGSIKFHLGFWLG